MKTYIYKLDIKNRTLSEIISAHTLFGAFCTAYQNLYGELDFLDKFLTPNPPFVFSSAFQYYKETLFFPNPVLPINFDEEIPISSIKKIKKITFVSSAVLKEMLNNKFKIENLFNPDLYSILHSRYLLKKEELWKDAKENKFMGQDLVTRNAYPLFPENEKHQRFEKNYYYFHKDAGLFFLVKIKEEFEEKFDTVWHYLEDEGLGGQKSIGIGAFQLIEKKQFDFPKTNLSILLSPMLPTDKEIKEIQNNDVYYELETKRLKSGLIDNKFLWKPKLTFLKEGSVLPFNSVFAGTNLPLNTNNEPTIVQYGLGYLMGAV